VLLKVEEDKDQKSFSVNELKRILILFYSPLKLTEIGIVKGLPTSQTPFSFVSN
jgi:hypothetical protein